MWWNSRLDFPSLKTKYWVQTFTLTCISRLQLSAVKFERYEHGVYNNCVDTLQNLHKMPHIAQLTSVLSISGDSTRFCQLHDWWKGLALDPLLNCVCYCCGCCSVMSTCFDHWVCSLHVLWDVAVLSVQCRWNDWRSRDQRSQVRCLCVTCDIADTITLTQSKGYFTLPQVLAGEYSPASTCGKCLSHWREWIPRQETVFVSCFVAAYVTMLCLTAVCRSCNLVSATRLSQKKN